MENLQTEYPQLDLNVTPATFTVPGAPDFVKSAEDRQAYLQAANSIAEDIKQEPAFDDETDPLYPTLDEEKYKAMLKAKVGHLEGLVSATYWKDEDLSGLKAAIAIGKQRLG